MMKNGNVNHLFLAKNKNEDSDLGWTADKKNLDKLWRSRGRVFFDGSQCYRVINQRNQKSVEISGDSALELHFSAA